MSNKKDFIKYCLLLLEENNTENKAILAKKAVDVFKQSKMIEYTSEKFKIESIKEIEEIIHKYQTNNGVSKADVHQMFIFQSQFIAD